MMTTRIGRVIALGEQQQVRIPMKKSGTLKSEFQFIKTAVDNIHSAMDVVITGKSKILHFDNDFVAPDWREKKEHISKELEILKNFSETASSCQTINDAFVKYLLESIIAPIEERINSGGIAVCFPDEEQTEEAINILNKTKELLLEL